MIEKALYEFLTDSAFITNVVGKRVYVSKVPEKVQGACIVLRRFGDDPEYGIAGESGSVDSTVQIDCYDETATKADALHNLVRNRLSGYRGTAGSEYIQSATIISSIALSEEPEDSSDKWTESVRTDYRIWHSQSVPTFT